MPLKITVGEDLPRHAVQLLREHDYDAASVVEQGMAAMNGVLPILRHDLFILDPIYQSPQGTEASMDAAWVMGFRKFKNISSYQISRKL
ncbi:MAG: hypothetical protein M1282_01010 [Chloroflexi bacterium]|nr:hypothetical protein [Chloroflexota bacterium]